MVGEWTEGRRGGIGNEWRRLKDQLKLWVDALDDVQKTMRDQPSADALQSLLRI